MQWHSPDERLILEHKRTKPFRKVFFAAFAAAVAYLALVFISSTGGGH